MQNLSPLNPRLRPGHSSSDKGTGRPTPMKATPLKASHQITATSVSSPDSGSASPTGSSTPPAQSPSPSNLSTNHRVIAHNYDLTTGSVEGTPEHRARSLEKDCSENTDIIRRRDGSGGSRRRTISPARVKVVPVGSILGPRVDSPNSGPFIPTPPPGAERPQLPRPSSADRFRKMVMQYREAT